MQKFTESFAYFFIKSSYTKIKSKNIFSTNKFLTLFFLATLSVSQAYSSPYFAFESLDKTLLDEPYKGNDPRHLAEISQIKKIQLTTKKKDIDEALSERKLQPETLTLQIDQNLTRVEFPNLYNLLDRVGETSRDINEGFKETWKITRPYLFDSKVRALITPSEGYSYPSGHSVGSHIYAHVLSILIPEKNQQLKDLASKIAFHRVQVGMHHPQDIEAGKKLALILVGGLLQNKEFQHDLRKAKDELKKAKIIQ